MTVTSTQTFYDLILFIIIFYAASQTIELANQMVLIPLKHRKAIAKLKNKFSLLKIYLVNDKLSMFVVYYAEFSIVLVVILFSVTGSNFGLLPSWVPYLGVIIMLFGESIRLWATYILGKFFTFPLIITKDQKLIVRGPYRIVRHPGYLGGIIIAAGIGLLVRSWIMPIIAVIIICLAYTYRIYLEEKALRKKFGDKYIEYSKRTAMIIPYLI